MLYPAITSILGFNIQHSKIHCLQYAPKDLTNPQAPPKILDVFHPGIQIDSTQIVGEVHHFKADEEHVSYDY
ncbi:hypothetical protein [Candidatus Tisiphia endosymbiont of Nemotelus uliginosus]|uniref:hypothetical protein n=1 Tax=Candidatus Tisiphia endosymbiont of Nemotelus uliginosus TaxID=3077926 RepID=UPI0035C91EAF